MNQENTKDNRLFSSLHWSQQIDVSKIYALKNHKSLNPTSGRRENLTSPNFSVNMDEVPISVALWVKEKWK
jgi:hypothetical protein